MRFPRMTTKRLMIAVAIVAGSLAASRAGVELHRAHGIWQRVAFCQERSEYFAQIVDDSRRAIERFEAQLFQEKDAEIQLKLKEQIGFERAQEMVAEPLRRRWDQAALQPTKSLPADLPHLFPLCCAFGDNVELESRNRELLSRRW